MTSTIHMDVEAANSAARQLSNHSQLMIEHVDALQQSTARLQSAWEGASRDEFFAELPLLMSRIKQQSTALTEMTSRLEREIIEWEVAAANLGGASSSTVVSSPVASPAPAVVTPPAAAPAPAAVGVSAAAAVAAPVAAASVAAPAAPAPTPLTFSASTFTKEYQGLNWSTKFSAEKKLLDQIAALEKQKKTGNWSVNNENQLRELVARKQSLQSVISAGITDKPSSSSTQGRLAGCTNYVARKRNIDAFTKYYKKSGDLNAENWNNRALQAGYEVGSRPVVGSIMVFEDNNNVFKTGSAGHVAYVTAVKEVKGGYQVTFSHGGVKYNSSGDAIYGTYVSKPVTTKTITSSSKGVSFIYTKKK